MTKGIGSEVVWRWRPRLDAMFTSDECAMLLLRLTLLLTGVPQAPTVVLTPTPWVVLYVDADYRISLDTWHLHGETDGDIRFNREEIQSELRCTPLGSRTRETALFKDHGPLLRRRPGDGAARNAPWKIPGEKSIDIVAMRAACRVLGAKGAR